MPLADCRCCVLVITNSHHFRHFLLQIGQIERRLFVRILPDCARRVVNRVATEDEKRFYFAAMHPVGQLQNVFRVPIARKFPDHHCASDILQRGVHRVREQLNNNRLLLAGENDAHARFRDQIVR